MSQLLRPYQEKAIIGLRNSMSQGNRRIILASPTGSGKTTISSYMIKGAVSKQIPSLFLAHRKELIDQCSQRLSGEGVSHGIIKAGYPTSNELVQVASKSSQSRLNRSG
jgi:DNA repair protein RadD